MSKRRDYYCAESQHSSGKRSRRQKYLYLVLDDWIKGFTVHKIDADSFHSHRHDDDDDRDSARDNRVAVAAAGHLTAPPAVRLQTPGEALRTGMLFTAVGDKIFVVTDQHFGRTPALTYDTATAALAFGPRAPDAHLQRRGVNVVVPAGDALYAFSPPVYNAHHANFELEVMSWKPAAAALDRYNPNRTSSSGSGEEEEGALSWTSLPGPHPQFERLEVIAAYAVHPDGHTIFMTTCRKDKPGILKSTLSFDTKTCVWKWHSWVLPFRGPGFFDRELDAWVGLHRRNDHICCCRVDAVDSGSATPIKLGLVQLDLHHQILENSKLFRNKDRDRHLRASLTYMGASEFCLVETAIHRGESEDDFRLNAPDGCAVHMTIFTLKYSHRGELRAASHRSTRSYLVPKYRDRSFGPVAFWM